jgi:hypothetical protein
MKKLLALSLLFITVSCEKDNSQNIPSQQDLAQDAINNYLNLEASREFYNQPFDAPGYFLVEKELEECKKSFKFTYEETQQATYNNNQPCLIVEYNVDGENCAIEGCSFERLSESLYYPNGNLAFYVAGFQLDDVYERNYFDFNGTECEVKIPEAYKNTELDESLYLFPLFYADCSLKELRIFQDNDILKRKVFFHQTPSGGWRDNYYTCIYYFNNESENNTDKYQTTYYGGDINCESQNIFKKNMELDIVSACNSPTKYSLARFLTDYGLEDYEANKDSTSELGRLIYQQRYFNLELKISFWEVDDNNRYRTSGQISELCIDYLKEESHYDDYK